MVANATITAESGIEGAVRTAQVVTVLVTFGRGACKDRTLILSDGVDPEEVLQAIAETNQGNLGDWDCDWGTIEVGRGKKRRVLAQWATTHCDMAPQADQAQVIKDDPNKGYVAVRTIDLD